MRGFRFEHGGERGLIEADFVRAELPPNSTTITTPIFLGPAGDISSSNPNDTSVGKIVFLKFKIPDVANVVSIDSFDFFVTVYDDGDGGGKSGDIDFAQPGTNLQFPDTFTSLNHTTAGNLRRSNGIATIDGVDISTPEPSFVLFMTAGFSAIAGPFVLTKTLLRVGLSWLRIQPAVRYTCRRSELYEEYQSDEQDRSQIFSQPGNGRRRRHYGSRFDQYLDCGKRQFE